MYAGVEYAGGPYAGSGADDAPIATDTQISLAIEISFTTGALETPVWVDVTSDVRSWDVQRGRRRELERFQPGRATVVLGNLSRQYDSLYAAGPYYGNIKPNRRIRIRETFNSVTYPTFDGYIDKWQLSYPNAKKDAIATVTATDGFKILNRTAMGDSVYRNAVLADAPVVYWPLDEILSQGVDATATALNKGTLGTTGNGTVEGPPLRIGGQKLVVNDDGGSYGMNQDTLGESVFLKMGAKLPNASYAVFPNAPFVFEMWCFPIEDPPGTVLDDAALAAIGDGSGGDKFQLLYDVSASKFVAAVANNTPTTYVVTASATSQRVKRHHVVFRFENGVPLRLWVDGVLTSGDTPSGSFTNASTLHTYVGYNGVSPGNNNWVGDIAHAAIYTGSAASAVDQTWVDRHYAAGTTPWQDDLPGARIGRALDIAGWPSTLRSIDVGLTTLQSATIGSQSVLEHSQKVSETEFGLFFVGKDGNVRFVDRTALFARSPWPVAFSDSNDGVEPGYRDLVPDDGDEVIRNVAIISRLNGVAQTVSDSTSITANGRFEYTLDGLLNRTDAYSATYATFIKNEYKDPRRRITALTIGPPIRGDEDIVYPPMLGLELGNTITVQLTPTGGGTEFSQVCAIEGIRASGRPGGDRTTTFILSPGFTNSIF